MDAGFVFDHIEQFVLSVQSPLGPLVMRIDDGSRDCLGIRGRHGNACLKGELATTPLATISGGVLIYFRPGPVWRSYSRSCARMWITLILPIHVSQRCESVELAEIWEGELA